MTAFQILLQESAADAHYAKRTAGALFHRLRPAHVTVIVAGKLLQLDSHKAEFLLFNLFVALFHTVTRRNVDTGHLGLRASNFTDVLERLPRSTVPHYRTRRQYVSHVLARNEVDREAPYNRRIFRRTSRGYYVLNPDMRVRIGGEWIGVYDLLEPEALLVDDSRIVPRQFRDIYIRNMKHRHQVILEFLAAKETVAASTPGGGG